MRKKPVKKKAPVAKATVSASEVLKARTARLAARSGQLPEVVPTLTGIPLGQEAIGKTWGKYKSRMCIDDEGFIYHSLLEREALREIRALERQGFIKNLKRQEECAYNFGLIKLPHGKLRRKYLPDAAFDCVKSFSMISMKGPIQFEAGKHYVVDIKSPATIKNEIYKLKRELMMCFFGVKIVEVIRKSPRPVRKG